AANHSIRSHDAFGNVEPAALRQGLRYFACEGFPIVGVYERQILLDARRPAAWSEAVDLEQLGRPMLEARGVECPTARVRKSLSFSKVELGLLALLDVLVDRNPTQERSIGRSQGVGATDEPAVCAFAVTHPKTHLTPRAGA